MVYKQRMERKAYTYQSDVFDLFSRDERVVFIQHPKIPDCTLCIHPQGGVVKVKEANKPFDGEFEGSFATFDEALDNACDRLLRHLKKVQDYQYSKQQASEIDAKNVRDMSNFFNNLSDA